MKQTLTQIGWPQITGKPKTLAGYGISDQVVLTTGSYPNPPWITSLEWGKIVGAPVFDPTLFEPALGNPLVDGYILSSTAAGARSWISPPSGGGGGAAGAGVIGEVPTGVIGTTNTVFSLLYSFIPETLIVYLNGLRQRLTIDFTIVAANQFALTQAPLAGDSLLADYYQPPP